MADEHDNEDHREAIGADPYNGDRAIAHSTGTGASAHVSLRQESQAANIMQMLTAVVMRGGAESMAMVEKLWSLKKEVDAYEARNAFNTAFALAKAEMPTIKKNRRVFFEGKNGKANTDYRHEDLAEVVSTVTPILGKYGMGFDFDVSNEINEPIRVTCIVWHQDGHEKRRTLIGARDDSGSKNALQQVGSTLTYLQRMTLKSALGLAAEHDDDGIASGDGDSPGNDPISDEQYNALMQMTVSADAESRDVQQLCTVLGVNTLKELPVSKYSEAIGHINEFADFKRAEATRAAAASAGKK